MGRLMADIGDIVVTAHSDDADDDDGMVPASGATASGADLRARIARFYGPIRG